MGSGWLCRNHVVHLCMCSGPTTTWLRPAAVHHPLQGKSCWKKEGQTLHTERYTRYQKNLGHVAHVSASDIVRGYNDEIIFVKVPIGFPLWKYWTQVPGTDTWRVVNIRRERIWLYLFTTFRSKMLTQALLHASDPWFCQQKHTSLVDVLMPHCCGA